MHKIQKMHKSEKRSNLCENIGFEKFHQNWQDHNHTTITVKQNRNWICIAAFKRKETKQSSNEKAIVIAWKTLLSLHGNAIAATRNTD